MADKRINALATTASSTASDDFIAVDGTTNGTRKLSAFSPTFGGNATVTGTLTANGLVTGSASTTLDSLPTSAIFGGSKRVAIGYDTTNDWGFIAAPNTGISWQELRLNPYGGVVKIPTSTAASSTISGALVVGNGVDGGIGASGSVWSGGTLTATTGTNSGVLQLNLINNSAGNAASSLFRFNAGTRTATLQAYNDTHATLAGQLRIATSNGDIAVIPSGVTAATFGASAISLGAINYANTITGGDTGSGTNILLLKDGLGTLKVNFKGNGDVALLSTTASTSTSSGALVVSGGVGVGGKVTSTAVAVANTSQSIAAWGDIGPQLSVAGAVITDISSSGTVSRFVSNSIAASSIAASSSTTYTQAATLFIAAGPTANTNVTISNSYALFVASGRINFGGLPTSSAGLQAGTLWNDSGTLKVA